MNRNDRIKPVWSFSAKFIPAVILLQLFLFANAQGQADAEKKADSEESKKVDQAYIQEHYTKFEYDVPMRDGIKLFTSVYQPKDDSEAYPILLTRTPYSLKPYSVDRYPDPRGPLLNYAKERFIFVVQDVRGRYGSEGEFVHMRPHIPLKSGPNDIDESTDAYDTIDWVVKLIDVYSGDFPNPDPNPTDIRMGGYQQLVRGEAMRGKFRNDYGHPDPFVPGEVTKVEYILPDIYHTFRRGHRIMVQVQSSWFPLVDRNPQTFCDIYKARESDFQKATQRLYHSGQAASQLRVSVME